MTLSRLENLYRQVILDHSQHPRNKGLLADSSNQIIEMNNPTCGDVIQLQVVLDNDQKIKTVKFDGHGCSISMASASMMSEVIIGKTMQEAMTLSQDFSKMVQGQEVDTEALGDAALLAGVAKFPARIKCATLAWKALEKSKENTKRSE